MMSKARQVLREDPLLAESVRNGTETLDKALQDIRVRQARARREVSEVETLENKAPDLYEAVQRSGLREVK